MQSPNEIHKVAANEQGLLHVAAVRVTSPQQNKRKIISQQKDDRYSVQPLLQQTQCTTSLPLDGFISLLKKVHYAIALDKDFTHAEYNQCSLALIDVMRIIEKVQKRRQ